MLRVSGRRLSSLRWNLQQTTSAFLSGNYLNGGGCDAAAAAQSLSRSVNSPLPFSFTSHFPHLIRGLLFEKCEMIIFFPKVLQIKTGQFYKLVLVIAWFSGTSDLFIYFFGRQRTNILKVFTWCFGFFWWIKLNAPRLCQGLFCHFVT